MLFRTDRMKFLSYILAPCTYLLYSVTTPHIDGLFGNHALLMYLNVSHPTSREADPVNMID